jgi:predicted transcriptional regulator
MVPFAALAPETSWHDGVLALHARGLSQLPVVEDGRVLGWVGDRELARAALAAELAPTPPPL